MPFERSVMWPETDVPEDYFIGVDLGQSNDYTAIVVLEGLVYRDHYKVTGLERMRGMDYPIIIKKIEDIMNNPADLLGECPSNCGPNWCWAAHCR